MWTATFIKSTSIHCVLFHLKGSWYVLGSVLMRVCTCSCMCVRRLCVRVHSSMMTVVLMLRTVSITRNTNIKSSREWKEGDKKRNRHAGRHGKVDSNIQIERMKNRRMLNFLKKNNNSTLSEWEWWFFICFFFQQRTFTKQQQNMIINNRIQNTQLYYTQKTVYAQPSFRRCGRDCICVCTVHLHFTYMCLFGFRWCIILLYLMLVCVVFWANCLH